MTGQGDELKPDLLNQLGALNSPDVTEDAAELPSPLGSTLDELLSAGDENILDDELAASLETTGSSIFDDPIEAPMQTEGDIPDAVPNISDGGTEILAHGRVEIQDFTEKFATASDPESEENNPSVIDLSHGAIGGLLNDLESVDISPTVIMEPQEHQQMGHEQAVDEVLEARGSLEVFGSEFRPDAELVLESSGGEYGMESIGSSVSDLGMSLSDVTSAVGVAATTTAAFNTPPQRATSAPAPAGNRTLLVAIGGYAVVVTVLCVLLLSLLSKARSAGALESLPDVPPVPPGKISLFPFNAVLPPGHTLAFGESQRFGNLKIEPLKVTRGPVEFVYSGGKEAESFRTEPVLKLWVKLTNASLDQAFVPLDAEMLFKRDKSGTRSNSFIVQKQDQPAGTPVVLAHYDELLKKPDWTLAGQRLGQLLPPGESVEIYIPSSEEGIERLSGELLWRMHVRKGHSPSGNGVTTLVDVAFRDDQIQPDGT